MSRVYPLPSSTSSPNQHTNHRTLVPSNNDESSASQYTGGGTSSVSGSYVSSLAGKSIVNGVGLSLFSLITKLRPKESLVGRESTFMFLWMIFYHVYLIYNSVIVSSITTPLIDDSSTTKLWGVIPAWIWRCLYFPINLASEFYPYYVIVSLSILILGFQLLTCVAIYYCKWASRKGGSFYEKAKTFIMNSLIFQRTFTLFITSIQSLLLATNISNKTPYYFPSEELSSVTHIVFMVIGCVGLFLNIFLTAMSIYLTVETSPPLSYRVLFSLYSISPFILLNLVNQLSLIATIICMSQYSFIASILKIILNLVLLLVMLKSFPFFRKWENTLYIALIFLKVFTPVPPLVLHFLQFEDQQVIGGVMTGVTVAVAVLSFIGGLVFGHLLISFKLSSIRKLISTKSEGNNICMIIDQSKKKQDALALFIRFAISSKHNSEESDFSLAKHSVNNFVKSIENPDLLIASALFVSFGGIEEYDDSQSYNIGLALLQKAQKNSPSLLQLFNIVLRNEEIEYHAFHGNNLEVLRKLALVEKKVKSLSRCHKSFFKELLNDKPSIDKLEYINRASCSIYNECDTIYDNMLLTNRSNKTLLRSYACYLEKYKWEYNLARDLFEEAQDNDDDKKHKPILQISKIHEPTQRANTSRFSIDSQRANIENWDSVSVAEENDEDRKDHVLRSAINTPVSTILYSVLFTLFCIMSIATICIVAPISLSFSQSINERMSMQEKVCLMTSVPYKLLAQIGALQIEFSLRGNISERLLNSTTVYTQDVIDTISDVMHAGDNNLLMPEVAKEYLKNQYELKIPITNESLSGTNEIPGYRVSNTSIQFYLSSMYSQGKTLFKQFQDMEKLIDTKLDENYPFLFLFYNRHSMVMAFNSLCSTFVEESVNVLEQNFQHLWITVISVLLTYSVASVVYFSFIYVHSRRLITELKEIFKKITKDEIGKVYHNFDKRTDDTIRSSNSILKMRSVVMIGSVLLPFVVCLCSVFVVLELHINTKTISQSMNVVGSINYVALRTSRTNFRLQWYIQRYKYMTTPSELFNEENKQDLFDLRTYWNYVIVGDESTGFKSVVVGKYEEVDFILGNFCNDSIPMDDPCHSLTSTLTDYITKSLDYNEVFNSQRRSKASMANTYFDELFYVTQTITKNLQYLISYLVEQEKVSSIGLTASMIVLCFVATLLYAIICYTSLKKYWKERMCLRMMLNYINLELIENSNILKEYVLTNSISSFKMVSKIKSKFDDNDEKEDKIEMVKTILNGGVDSAIICDKDGNITIFNNSAEEMFGYSRSQVLGLSIENLFSEEDSKRITKLISTGESNDSFEATALRKNKTSFTSKVSVSVSIHEKKQILVFFIRDISPEKKHSILIAEEKKKSEDLLLNILPMSMASRLKNGEENLYEKVNDITVFFSDMVGFTAWSSKLEPSELVQLLNLIVHGFDKLTEIHLIDKIKTIGDAYFCVSGLHSSKSSDHPERMLRFAIEVMALLKKINQTSNTSINLRIGIHTGDAVGGVIGFKKFAYDLWGDTINTASRMESTSLPGRIQISRSTYGRVYDLFEFEERMVEVKGKGMCQTYLLKDKHHEHPLDSDLEVSHHDSSNKMSAATDEIETQELKNYYENLSSVTNEETKETENKHCF